jgi:hypothetical protein
MESAPGVNTVLDEKGGCSPLGHPQSTVQPDDLAVEHGIGDDVFDELHVSQGLEVREPRPAERADLVLRG